LFSKKQIVWVYAISLIFILINAFFIAKELFFFSLLPFALVIAFYAFFSLDKLLFLIVFLTPLSIPLKEIAPGLDFDMQLPTEPLLFGVLILFIFKLLVERKFDKKILTHPITIAIFINLGWILITSLTSTMPIVSIKFLISRLWFVVAFYFLATQLFIKFENISKYIWLYIISFIIVIGYTINNHLAYGLINQEAAHHVMDPFYNDHTSYGAMLAMFMPLLIGFIFNSRFSKLIKIISLVVLCIFITAIILSYTRAAWIGLVGALCVYILVRLKIKFRTVFITSTVLLSLFFVFQTDIMIKLEQNNQDSSTDLTKHIKSMSNVSTDASNLERINRWNCAMRMFEQRPFLGWGPGTYMFQYAPFQLSYEKTIISTNAADGGNAHSEYIGPLSESGVLGSITFIILIIVVIYTALKVYRQTEDREIKMLSMGMLLGLITYFIHGFLNNFLDTDKASVPFWGFIAVIVALDVYHQKPQKKKIDFNTEEKEA